MPITHKRAKNEIKLLLSFEKEKDWSESLGRIHSKRNQLLLNFDGFWPVRNGLTFNKKLPTIRQKNTKHNDLCLYCPDYCRVGGGSRLVVQTGKLKRKKKR